MFRPNGLAAILAVFLLPALPARAAAPEQPIRFSHARHVRDLRIDCRFCHASASKSASAGVPSVEKCMGCHRSAARDNPEVRKVAAASKDGKPVAWIRVTGLPDHVHFPHFRMVGAGIACLHCHPGLDRAEGAEQRVEFTMGWCMKCHRQRGASIDCWTCHK